MRRQKPLVVSLSNRDGSKEDCFRVAYAAGAPKVWSINLRISSSSLSSF